MRRSIYVDQWRHFKLKIHSAAKPVGLGNYIRHLGNSIRHYSRQSFLNIGAQRSDILCEMCIFKPFSSDSIIFKEAYSIYSCLLFLNPSQTISNHTWCFPEDAQGNKSRWSNLMAHQPFYWSLWTARHWQTEWKGNEAAGSGLSHQFGVDFSIQPGITN